MLPNSCKTCSYEFYEFEWTVYTENDHTYEPDLPAPPKKVTRRILWRD